MIIESLGLSLGENTPTGVVEISSLKDIDVSVGNRILELVARLKVTIPSGVNENHPRLKPLKSLQDFLSREPNKQMGYGRFDTPAGFLKAFNRQLNKSAPKGEQEGSKKRDYKVQLPLMYIARDQGLAFSDDGRRDIKKAKELQRDGRVIGEVDCYVMNLNYQLHFVGWNEEDISMLALHVLTEIRNGAGTAENVEVSTAFADTEAFTLDWNFLDKKMLTAEPASLPFDEGRLYGLTIAFPIEAELAKVRYVTEERGDVVGRGVIRGG